MKKRSLKLTAAALFMGAALGTTALAGEWKQDGNGWRYEDSPVSYAQDGWQWIDGNNDGLSECYYFNAEGYLVTAGVTPDGYTVNADGAWVEDGAIRQRAAGPAGAVTQIANAERLYYDASNRTSQLDSLSARAKIDMDMQMQGIAIPMLMDMQMKFKGLNGDGLKYYVESKANVLGTEMDSTMFYADGWYYMDMYGMKYKMQMPLDQMMAEAKSTAQSMGIGVSYFDSAQVTNMEDGSKLISYTSDPEKLNEEMLEVYERMGLSLSSLGADSINIRQADGIRLTSYEVPEGCDKNNFTYESFSGAEYAQLKRSEKFNPALYVQSRDGVWEGGSVSMFSPVLKFTLFERFSADCLEVSEQMEVNGKRTFGYDRPIVYRRVKNG